MKHIHIVLLSLFLLSNCARLEEIKAESECDFLALVNKEIFENEPSNSVTIDSLEVSGNCLTIVFSSSGCNGDTWVFKLIDSEEILELPTPQRNLRFVIRNLEDCRSWVTKEVTFDISNLQVRNGNEVELLFTNNDELITYTY